MADGCTAVACMRFRLPALVLGLLLSVSACGDDDGVVPGVDGGGRDTGGGPDTGTGGTVVVSADGMLTLRVPDGALPAGVAAEALRLTLTDSPNARGFNNTSEEREAGDLSADGGVRAT